MITRHVPVVIPSGGTDSAIIVCDMPIMGYVMPASLTGTAISFQVSVDKVNFVTLYDSTNTAISRNVSAARAYGVDGDLFAALSLWKYVKIVSGSTEAADRTITVVQAQ